MNLNRVVILADASADWTIAGLRQLDRLALAIDEYAVQNAQRSPVTVCVLWQADLDLSQRWVPNHPRLTHVAFVTESDAQPYDLVLSTRLFVYRKGIARLLEEESVHRPDGAGYAAAIDALPALREGGWEKVAAVEQIEAVEERFLRASGKSQDGFVSRHLNRPISRAVTRLLLPTSITPNQWTWMIFPIPLLAALIMSLGTYASFLAGMLLFHIFSVLDGCDGELARAKFMDSEEGRRLDDLFDVLSNILLVLGLGAGLRHAHPPFGWLLLSEGIATALLIALSEWILTGRKTVAAVESKDDSLGGALYPRHRDLVARSGLLFFGEKFASIVVQLTKRDVAVLFFVLLAAVGMPALILHLVFVVTALTLALALRAR